MLVEPRAAVHVGDGFLPDSIRVDGDEGVGLGHCCKVGWCVCGRLFISKS